MSSFVTAMNTVAAEAGAVLGGKLILGENGSPEYSVDGVGDARVALFTALVRNLPEQRLVSLVEAVVAQARREGDAGVLADLVVLAFQTRNARGGKGERALFQSLFLVLAQQLPETSAALVPLIPQYGYFKDLLLMLETLAAKPTAPPSLKGVQAAVLEVMVEQLRKDQAELKAATAEGRKPKGLSLAGKWAPRKGKHFSRGANEAAIYHAIRDALFPGKHDASKRYRELVSSLSRALDVPEVLMCSKAYDEIDFSRVPSVCLKRFRKAFLNEKLKKVPSALEQETGNRFPDDPKRVAARQHLRESAVKGKVKGGVLQPHEIASVFMTQNVRGRARDVSTLETDVLCAQWDQIRATVVAALSKAKEASGGQVADGAVDLGRLVPLVDVSGSMAGTPMQVAIALGILTSELASPPFAHRLLTFSQRPTWVDLSSATSLAHKVQTVERAEWGMNTDFGAALQLILDACVASKLPPAEVPSLIVFTDMQFDAASGQAAGYGYWAGGERREGWADQWETQHERMVRLFKEAGEATVGQAWEVPRIVFWNLRGDTEGFAAQADTPGVQMLSGFSPALLKLLLTGEPLVQAEATEEGGKTRGKAVVTPYMTLRAALDDQLYDPVRLVLHASQEGLLQHYHFNPTPAANEEVKEEGGAQAMEVEEEGEWEQVQAADTTA